MLNPDLRTLGSWSVQTFRWPPEPMTDPKDTPITDVQYTLPSKTKSNRHPPLVLPSRAGRSHNPPKGRQPAPVPAFYRHTNPPGSLLNLQPPLQGLTFFPKLLLLLVPSPSPLYGHQPSRVNGVFTAFLWWTIGRFRHFLMSSYVRAITAASAPWGPPSLRFCRIDGIRVCWETTAEILFPGPRKMGPF